ncbi:hypothetical protein GIB67_019995 [Kingdonia uniflora]|uniref:Uncharacterized protein n=1 Tax=Kingdonia uniflora TaxID=39325 RepID=A0A7J7MKN8_9MAGN|nr:hypothetical protein GIB67_019995 [Kingdonia uniflora]
MLSRIIYSVFGSLVFAGINLTASSTSALVNSSSKNFTFSFLFFLHYFLVRPPSQGAFGR